MSDQLTIETPLIDQIEINYAGKLATIRQAAMRTLGCQLVNPVEEMRLTDIAQMLNTGRVSKQIIERAFEVWATSGPTQKKQVRYLLGIVDKLTHDGKVTAANYRPPSKQRMQPTNTKDFADRDVAIKFIDFLQQNEIKGWSRVHGDTIRVGAPNIDALFETYQNIGDINSKGTS